MSAIADAVVAMYEQTGLTPVRGVPRCNGKACADGVCREVTGKGLHDHFGLSSSFAGGIVAGFDGRALGNYHTNEYRQGHAIGAEIARRVGLEGA